MKGMDQKLLYAFRGWIAFIAFMDMGTAVRCLIEKRSILGEHSFTKIDNLTQQRDDSTLPRILGAYSVLKALALIHCTLYIHYKPVVSMGICSLVLTLLVYISEALYYQSTTFNFYVLFPCVINALTLLGLWFLPRRLLETEPVTTDENAELLKMAGGMRRRRPHKVKDN
ncbi:Ergosterol biosynthetic protein 28-like protein [Frankliniella fusca]|uniref:Ergosterol biosynthetic protein 28-like protein n=1 Tax=Frankliniella fusca TaxID=407009 RepID=A0AAE1HST1_9NEOP|nr:Ergosterol biosynthetic protein 28-like protein [Frankliniella fusca]